VVWWYSILYCTVYVSAKSNRTLRQAEYALGIKLYGSWVHSLYNAGYRRTCKFRWRTCLHPYIPMVSSVILSIYLGWNSDTDIPFKENAAADDTLPRSSELIVSHHSTSCSHDPIIALALPYVFLKRKTSTTVREREPVWSWHFLSFFLFFLFLFSLVLYDF